MITLTNLRTVDTETHLTQPGLQAPPVVCVSTAAAELGSERVVPKQEGLAAFRALLQDQTVFIGGATLHYDLGVCAVEQPELLALIFDALERERLVDTEVLEKLHRNAIGTLDDYSQGNSLVDLEKRYLGLDRSQDKENGWRKRYALLEHLPITQWPDDAVQYPRQDARGTFDVLARQLGLTGALEHDWQPVNGDEFGLACTLCLQRNDVAPPDCPNGKPAPRHNLQCVAQEMRACFMLRLACIWGMRTDEVMVERTVGEIRRKHDESRKRFFQAGIVRVRPCNKKDGEYERADEIDLEWLADAEQTLLGMAPAEWITRRLTDIQKCRNALKKAAKKKTVRPLRFAEDRTVLRGMVETAYQGNPPLTAGGDTRGPEVSIARDTLEESGDPLLEEYGEAGANEKLHAVYCDVLEQGTRVPIGPGFNSTLSTQRTSYYEPNLQQLPRKGGVRECFVPRGYVMEAA